MVIGYVYVLTSPSGKHYVGQSKHVNNRWNTYCSLNCKDQTKLYNALKYYGPENFTFYIIDAAKTQEELDRKECYWIDSYDSYINGYNNLKGGLLGRNEYSQKSKNKMSESAKKRKHSQETKDKISRIVKGKKRRLETKQKISLSRMGSKNPIWKGGISKTPKIRKRKRYVCKLQHDNGEIVEVASIEKFCKERGLKDSVSMYYVKNGKYKSSQGWKLLDLKIID